VASTEEKRHMNIANAREDDLGEAEVGDCNCSMRKIELVLGAS
jgi:hypothetical protein